MTERAPPAPSPKPATDSAEQTPAQRHSVRGGGTTNSCNFAHDGECDETSGICAPGTDSADCRSGAAAADPANSCRYAFDKRCDEPSQGIGGGLCAKGTDTADCTAPKGTVNLVCELSGSCYSLNLNDDNSCPRGWGPSNGSYRIKLNYDAGVAEVFSPSLSTNSMYTSCEGDTCSGKATRPYGVGADYLEATLTIDRISGHVAFVEETNMVWHSKSVMITHYYTGTCTPTDAKPRF